MILLIVPVLKGILLRGEPEVVDDFVIPASADIGTADSEGVKYSVHKIFIK